MTISDQIIDFYSRTNEGFTRAEMSRVFPDIGVDTIGSAMYKLYKKNELEREKVEDSKYQAMKYYRKGAKVILKNMDCNKGYRFVKPAESLI